MENRIRKKKNTDFFSAFFCSLARLCTAVYQITDLHGRWPNTDTLSSGTWHRFLPTLVPAALSHHPKHSPTCKEQDRSCSPSVTNHPACSLLPVQKLPESKCQPVRPGRSATNYHTWGALVKSPLPLFMLFVNPRWNWHFYFTGKSRKNVDNAWKTSWKILLTNKQEADAQSNDVSSCKCPRLQVPFKGA